MKERLLKLVVQNEIHKRFWLADIVVPKFKALLLTLSADPVRSS